MEGIIIERSSITMIGDLVTPPLKQQRLVELPNLFKNYSIVPFEIFFEYDIFLPFCDLSN
jgi:hypothetical protein